MLTCRMPAWPGTLTRQTTGTPDSPLSLHYAGGRGSGTAGHQCAHPQMARHQSAAVQGGQTTRLHMPAVEPRAKVGKVTHNRSSVPGCLPYPLHI
jgi:hypothetical protein